MLSKVKLFETTDASGDFTKQDTVRVMGEILKVEWTDGDFDNGVDAVLSCVRDGEAADETILTLTDADNDAAYYPTAVQCNNVGAARTAYVPIVVDGFLKLVVSDGGNAKRGGCTVYLKS